MFYVHSSNCCCCWCWSIWLLPKQVLVSSGFRKEISSEGRSKGFGTSPSGCLLYIVLICASCPIPTPLLAHWPGVISEGFGCNPAPPLGPHSLYYTHTALSQPGCGEPHSILVA